MIRSTTIMVMMFFLSLSCETARALSVAENIAIASSLARVPMGYVAAEYAERGDVKMAAGLDVLISSLRLYNHVEHCAHTDTLKTPLLYWGTRDAIALLRSFQTYTQRKKQPVESINQDDVLVDKGTCLGSSNTKNTYALLMALEAAVDIAQIISSHSQSADCFIREKTTLNDLVLAIFYTLIREAECVDISNKDVVIKNVLLPALGLSMVGNLEAAAKVDSLKKIEAEEKACKEKKRQEEERQRLEQEQIRLNQKRIRRAREEAEQNERIRQQNAHQERIRRERIQQENERRQREQERELAENARRDREQQERARQERERAFQEQERALREKIRHQQEQLENTRKQQERERKAAAEEFEKGFYNSFFGDLDSFFSGSGIPSFQQQYQRGWHYAGGQQQQRQQSQQRQPTQPKPKEETAEEKALRTLGLDPKKQHSKEDLKKAYKKAMKNSHPDKNMNDTKNATARTQDITAAKTVLNIP